MKITFRYGDVPEGMKIKQVYGIVFTDDGRTLVRIENKSNKRVFSMAGGTPEAFDVDVYATLEREMKEEVNTTLKKPYYVVGYQEIDEENGKPAYAQLRMTAMIEKIGEKLPDPDNGETYDRLLTSPQRMIELLGWGECGKLQIEEAKRIAEEKFGVTLKNLEEEYV